MGAFRHCWGPEAVVGDDSGVVGVGLRSGQDVGLATLALRCNTPPPPFLLLISYYPIVLYLLVRSWSQVRRSR